MSSEADSDHVRAEVDRLGAWAPLAPEDDDFWQPSVVEGFAADIAAVAGPINEAERDRLLAVLNRAEDDAVYGVLWRVVHLIETSPADGFQRRLPTTDRPWFRLLRDRSRNLDQ